MINSLPLCISTVYKLMSLCSPVFVFELITNDTPLANFYFLTLPSSLLSIAS